MIPSGPDLATPAAVALTLQRLRERARLVHSITNLVVTNSTANALLAIGASPAMVKAAEEAGEFAQVADALVINLGTMTPDGARSTRPPPPRRSPERPGCSTRWRSRPVLPLRRRPARPHAADDPRQRVGDPGAGGAVGGRHWMPPGGWPRTPAPW